MNVRSVLARAIALVLAVAGCAGADAEGGVVGGAVDLTGAGATFPYAIYYRWFSDYADSTGIRINYASLGSGAGIRQLSERTVDFGASDSPMTEAEMAKARGGPILHIPTVLGAVAITYNLARELQRLRSPTTCPRRGRR